MLELITVSSQFFLRLLPLSGGFDLYFSPSTKEWDREQWWRDCIRLEQWTSRNKNQEGSKHYASRMSIYKLAFCLCDPILLEPAAFMDEDSLLEVLLLSDRFDQLTFVLCCCVASFVFIYLHCVSGCSNSFLHNKRFDVKFLFIRREKVSNDFRPVMIENYSSKWRWILEDIYMPSLGEAR